MDYKKILIERLRNLNDERAALQNIPDRLAALEAKYNSIRSATTDSEPVTGGTSQREEALISNICERDMLEEDLEWSKREVESMNSNLAALEKEEQRALECFYVNGEKRAAERLCCELGYERTQIYRLKDKALLRLARRLYGQVKQ